MEGGRKEGLVLGGEFRVFIDSKVDIFVFLYMNSRCLDTGFCVLYIFGF